MKRKAKSEIKKEKEIEKKERGRRRSLDIEGEEEGQKGGRKLLRRESDRKVIYLEHFTSPRCLISTLLS